MRAVQISGVKTLEETTIAEPKSHDGYVVVELKKTGICGSDIHYWDMGNPKGLVMGHEICGVVVDPGSRDDLKVGDRVTALPISPCLKCDACKSGNVQACTETWTHGLGLSLDNPGGYAEFTSIRPDMVVKVPNNITDSEVAMVEPSAVSLHAVNLADFKIGCSVLVIGAGIIGQLAAMFAKMKGASYVAISEANAKRGKKAVDLGVADEYFLATDEKFQTNIREKCKDGYDIIIDCCGNSPALSSAIMAGKPRAQIVLVGLSMEPVTIPSALILMREFKVLGAAGYTYNEFVKCIELMANRKIDTLKFVDDVVGFKDVQKAFKRLTSGEDSAIKILIDPKK